VPFNCACWPTAAVSALRYERVTMIMTGDLCSHRNAAMKHLRLLIPQHQWPTNRLPTRYRLPRTLPRPPPTHHSPSTRRRHCMRHNRRHLPTRHRHDLTQCSVQHCSRSSECERSIHV
jgi:hypothetical protein